MEFSASATKDMMLLVYNVFVMEFQLPTDVIAVPIVQILNGVLVHAGVKMDIRSTMGNSALQIKLETIPLTPVMLLHFMISNKEDASHAQQDA